MENNVLQTGKGKLIENLHREQSPKKGRTSDLVKKSKISGTCQDQELALQGIDIEILK